MTNLANLPPRLNRLQASEYLYERHGIKRAPSTLAKLACIGGGPAFRKAGRWPLYDIPDLDAWVDKLLGEKQNSTSNARQSAKLEDLP